MLLNKLKPGMAVLVVVEIARPDLVWTSAQATAEGDQWAPQNSERRRPRTPS